MRAGDVTAMQDRDPGIIYASPVRSRDVYHITRECPYVSPGFLVLDERDTRVRRFRLELPECMWCRYDADNTLNLD